MLELACGFAVYVTSSSTILLGQSEPNTYDTAYSPGYYNASLLSTASTSSSLYYESAKIRSIFYEGDENEAQEISLYVEGLWMVLFFCITCPGVCFEKVTWLDIYLFLCFMGVVCGHVFLG